MKTTVKRLLWQRILETAGPLRQPLPKAPAAAPELGGLFDWAEAYRAKCEQRRRAAAPLAGKLTVHELATAYARALVADTVKDAAAEFQEMHLCKPFSALAGGEHRGGVGLVGESGPELQLTIPAGALKVGKPLGFSRCTDRFLASIQQMVREINGGTKK